MMAGAWIVVTQVVKYTKFQFKDNGIEASNKALTYKGARECNLQALTYIERR